MKELLNSTPHLHVQQAFEAFEMLGFETRNKYRIYNDQMRPLYFAAEQSSGILDAILRNMLGHWKSFDIHIFDHGRALQYKANFPFRWFFKTLYLKEASGRSLGHIQQRFAILRKKFDVYDSRGKVVAQINSSLFKMWTFEFKSLHKNYGKIEKKWSGMFNEFFSDKDNFIITFGLDADEEMRVLMLATCLMVDIIYFENNKGSKSLNFGD